MRMTKLSTLIALTAAAVSGACSVQTDADDTAAIATDLGSGTGLKGEYYDNVDFTALKMTRIDPTVRFDWQSGSPSSSMAADRFSIRWTGKVAANYSETYTFYVNSDDGVRLWVGGKLVIDAWNDHPATETQGTVTLKAGQQTDIRLEYYNGYGLASVQLSWSSASQMKRTIPRSALYPSTTSTGGGTTTPPAPTTTATPPPPVPTTTATATPPPPPPAPTSTATPPPPAPTTTVTPPPPPAPTTTATATPPPPPPPPATTGAPRPSYNKGTGFYVVGSKLYDANGNEFRIRGVNHLHWDSPSAGIPKTGANTERWDLDFNQPIASNIALMQKSIANKIVPMAGNWDGTCDENPATLSAMVSKWVATAPQWKAVEKYMLVNIANEWGPANSTVWRDQYIAAIASLRAAGINATIVVDAGGCGQDLGDLTQYAAAVFNSDPQKNVIFDQHIYGMWQSGGSSSWQTDLTQGLNALAATGLPFVVGEFGPGRNIGPSPTDMTPGLIIQAAESRGFGWIAWAWDDPPGEWTNPITDDWFALSFTGNYDSSADLTTFGKDVIENAVYGLKKMGKPASIF